MATVKHKLGLEWSSSILDIAQDRWPLTLFTQFLESFGFFSYKLVETC